MARYLDNPFSVMVDRAEELRAPAQQRQFDRAVEHAELFPGNRYDTYQMLRNAQGWGGEWYDPRQDDVTRADGYIPRTQAPSQGGDPFLGDSNPYRPDVGPGSGTPGDAFMPPTAPAEPAMPAPSEPTAPAPVDPTQPAPSDPFTPQTATVVQWRDTGGRPSNEAFYDRQFNRLYADVQRGQEAEKQARGQWNAWQQGQNQKAAASVAPEVNWDMWNELADRPVPTVGEVGTPVYGDPFGPKGAPGYTPPIGARFDEYGTQVPYNDSVGELPQWSRDADGNLLLNGRPYTPWVGVTGGSGTGGGTGSGGANQLGGNVSKL